MAIIGFLLFIHMVFGRLAVAIVPIYWAYSRAQRGDSFGHVVLFYFGDFIVLSLIWGAIYWVLNTLLKGVMFD